jgi:hypothetical protein
MGPMQLLVRPLHSHIDPDDETETGASMIFQRDRRLALREFRRVPGCFRGNLLKASVDGNGTVIAS